MAKCRSCGADIEWTKNKRTGRRMPVDREPVPGGDIAVEIDANNEAVSWLLLPLVTYSGPRFVSHFSTCPNAESHRRGGEESA